MQTEDKSGDLIADAHGMNARDVELIRRLEAEGFTLLAVAVARCLERAADRAARATSVPLSPFDLVLRSGGWPRDAAVATDPGGRGHRTGGSLSLRRQRAS